ncbi:hypothetical protein FQN50_006028 [Emmonsiellopsis sp. PD_5]|nr:hypothetical protein FQN50_006028 [Emmonsiellopsis sp. PD_5]
MGFLSGFFSGIALTTTTLYITLTLHQATRHHQHLLLREQIDLINAIALPVTPSLSASSPSSSSTTAVRPRTADDPAIAAVMARRGYAPRDPRDRPGVLELAKERWNGEVRGVVRWVQEVRWEDVRGFLRGGEGVVRRVGRGAGEGE